MLPQMLHSVNTHLDVMLAPPYPKTQHDKTYMDTQPRYQYRIPPACSGAVDPPIMGPTQ
jgi:hypothetical protein